MCNIKPIFEFIIWDNCSNNCKFCYQKKHYHYLDNEQKEKSIENVELFLKSNEFINGSHVLLVGGELFDVYNKRLLNLYDTILSMMYSKNIDLLYINTNLIYDMNIALFELLDKINEKNLLKRVKFTTSWDCYGRFLNNEKENIFFENLKILREKYKELNIVVNSILSKQLCEKIMDDFDVIDEFKKIGCDVNLLPYIVMDDELTPSRNLLFNTLNKVFTSYHFYMKKYIHNFDLKQDKLIYRYIDGKLVFSSTEHGFCGHGENFKKYSTNGTCFICDIKELYDA